MAVLTVGIPYFFGFSEQFRDVLSGGFGGHSGGRNRARAALTERLRVNPTAGTAIPLLRRKTAERMSQIGRRIVLTGLAWA